ncbi:MAG: hypothetical protein QG596_765 [Actinomycetota bacterium]|jgi:ABC-type transport system involved in multi-copper enzyme maturation permease subunit|nr:hypothetical protein [Actinomycetota bacterium]
MRPELRKLTVLPTPRWTAVATLAAVLIAGLIIAITGAGKDHLALLIGLGMPTWIASVVLGVWMAGLEYGQKTMRRTLTRNPRRIEVVANKLAIAVLAGVGLTVLATLLAIPLFSLASSGHDLKVAAGDTLAVGIGNVANNVIYVVAGFSFGLITKSMAGGTTAALTFFFVIDSLLTEIPKVGDYMLAAVSVEIFQEIVGNDVSQTDLEVNLVRAILVSLLWLAAFVGLGTTRFVKTDID